MKITTILLAILLLLANLASAEKKKFANNAAAVAYIQQMMDERGQRLVVKDMTGSTTKVSQKGCVLVFEDKAQFTHPTGYNDSAKGYSEQRTVVTQLNIEYADLAGTASNISFLGDNNSIKISTLWSSGKDGHEEFPKVYTLPLDYNG
ncbi:MAG: hypothetical protein EBZ77_12685, partial [Chitinophagia bacterium]|nr:hypothetical protein [Chitinophagia bacterium]